MSRSTKKPYYTDRQRSKITAQLKRQANRRVRAAKEVADGKQYRKVSNSWDICDWSFHRPKDKKAYRK